VGRVAVQNLTTMKERYSEAQQSQSVQRPIAVEVAAETSRKP